MLLLVVLSCKTDVDQQSQKEKSVSTSLQIDSFVLYPPPSQLYGHLFTQIQQSNSDHQSLNFLDCVPRFPLQEIQSKIESLSNNASIEDLQNFINTNFNCVKSPHQEFVSDPKMDINDHIRLIWPLLEKNPLPPQVGSSWIPIPHNYVSSNGSNTELNYFQSYFILEGLVVDGKWDLIRHIVDNLAYMIEQIGHIPGTNRTYSVSRSHPPFFALMVSIVHEHLGDEILLKYYPVLQKEYEYWMDGIADIQNPQEGYRRVVKMIDFNFLNRYWDDENTPRDEAYEEDYQLAQQRDDPDNFYRNLRAACESGWNFSSRWILHGGTNIQDLVTTDIIPVDLNCLLYHLEDLLEQGAALNNHDEMVTFYRTRKNYRKEQIIDKCWDPVAGIFTDYNWKLNRKTAVVSGASLYPLFLGVADQTRANRMAEFVEKFMLQPGGIATTLTYSGLEWDTPYGWAPVQWVAVQGLRKYGFDTLADDIKDRWLRVNRNIFRNTGKMFDKYNISDITSSTPSSGYAFNDGYGWTNSIFLALDEEVDHQ